MDLFNEHQGESEQFLLSTENDKNLVKDMSSLSQANFTYGLIISKKKIGGDECSWTGCLVDEEEQVSPPLNSKLSPETSVFVL